MKLSFASSLLLLGGTACGTAGAFAPSSKVAFRPSSCLSMTKDTSEAVKAATEASEKYGKASPEARMAWEVVEEMDAANA